LPVAFRLGNLGIRAALAVFDERVIVEGLAEVPDEPGVIVASNHLSVVDPPLLSLLVARAVGRRVRYMAKAEVMAMPVVGRVLRAYGGFGVRRGQADREAYRLARAVLEGGDWLGLAPEGTRSREARLGEPKPGVVTLALRSNALVLPVGIAGSERTWPIGARLPRRGTTVTVRFGQAYRPRDGDPAAPEGSAEVARREDVAGQTELLMGRIAALLPSAYRGRFG